MDVDASGNFQSWLILASAAFAFQMKNLEPLVVTAVQASQSCLVLLLIAMHLKRHFRRCWCCPCCGHVSQNCCCWYRRCIWGGVSEVLMLYCFRPASQSYCFSCSSHAFCGGISELLVLLLWPCNSAAALN